MAESKTVGIDIYYHTRPAEAKLTSNIIILLRIRLSWRIFVSPIFYFLSFFVMTVPKAKKSETLAELKADLTRAKSFALVQSNRITVAEVSKVRR